MEKKGFPESYDLPTLLRFLADVKAGRRPVRAPIYSHLVYDVVPNQWVEVDRPDILIVEGLNVLQAGPPPKDGKAIPYVSDFFDFSVYIDAEEDVLHNGMSIASSRCARPRSAIRSPTSTATPARRSGGDRDRDLDLGADQPDQPARKHPADAPARPPDPQEGARTIWCRKWR